MPPEDLRGRDFGLLVVLYETVRRRFPCGQTRRRWLCLCQCGKRTAVQGIDLKRGHTKSCGCAMREINRVKALKHGHAVSRCRTREYRSWEAAKRRCTCPRDRKYPLYGGRGIKMAEEWRESFEKFFADMGQCPPGRTLNRIDNDGDYRPDNCNWATVREQNANRRPGVRRTAKYWSKR